MLAFGDLPERGDLGHLIPAARKTAALPAAERLERLRGDRWIGYTRAQQALAKLEELYTHPQRERMPNLLIVGPTNNGKSMIVVKFKRSKMVTPADPAAAETIPIVHLQMPSDPTIQRFYARLLDAIGAPFPPRARVAELETLALRILRRIGLRLLVIDEVHNLLAGSGVQQREFLNLLRFLGNELKVPLVCVGTRDAYLAIRSDDQLENRFQPMTLPVWRDDDEFAALLASFGAVLPLRRPSPFDDPGIRRYIIEKSEGTIGEIAALLRGAAAVAIETEEEAITRRALRLSEYESPTERRRQFERELI